MRASPSRSRATPPHPALAASVSSTGKVDALLTVASRIACGSGWSHAATIHTADRLPALYHIPTRAKPHIPQNVCRCPRPPCLVLLSPAFVIGKLGACSHMSRSTSPRGRDIDPAPRRRPPDRRFVLHRTFGTRLRYAALEPSPCRPSSAACCCCWSPPRRLPEPCRWSHHPPPTISSFSRVLRPFVSRFSPLRVASLQTSPSGRRSSTRVAPPPRQHQMRRAPAAAAAPGRTRGSNGARWQPPRLMWRQRLAWPGLHS